jgi:hypothetical protein
VARGSSTFTLSRPVQAQEMGRLLAAISTRVEAAEALARQGQQ